MRVVVQRVSQASVKINGAIKSQIRTGLMILLGIEEADNQEDIDWIVRKISNMRIFPDEMGVMNKSLLEVDGEVLLISQFTLHASTKKGNRPSYIKAAKAETAIPIYKKTTKAFEKELDKKIGTGEFGADMKVSLINDGPVTIIIDSKNRA